MRCACLVWLIAGCGFTGDPATTGDGPGSGPGSDPGSGSGSGSGTGTTGNTGGCDVTGATLRLCVSFGGTPMAQDLLDPPHALIDAIGVGPIDGILNSVAGNFGASSRLRFAESPDLDVGELTVMFWMRPAGKPAGGKRVWMLDNNMQYFASYEDNAAVRCGIGSTVADSKTTVPPGTWHHVACSYAPSDQRVKVYVDGNLSGCQDFSAPIPTSGIDGLAIGANYGAGGYKENYVGRLDTLHLYASALPAGEICEAAGKSGCNSQCPD